MKSSIACVVIFGFICATSAQSRYNPEIDTHYHLFTRRNPTVSQPLLNGNADILTASNYDPRLRTIISLHGRGGWALDDYNLVTIPAFLASGDVNLIVIDWGIAAGLTLNDTVTSGLTVASFVNWLKFITGRPAESFHIVGFSRGAQHAGVTARNVDGGIGYVTALDPPSGWANNGHIFRPDDGLYTEAIFTAAGTTAHVGNLAHVNFYPNGGSTMPGCGDNTCNHLRAYFYFAEAIEHGGFTGTECASREDAVAENCSLPGRHQMGRPLPSYGTTGTFHFRTNAGQPFSIN